MCELFGVSADWTIPVNDYLKTFFSHSVEHHNGWGLALLDDGLVSIEKEPVRAVDSQYLKNRLTGKVVTARCMAHIRKATIGDVSFSNTHPFVLNDNTGRKWVLVHNGTIFESDELNKYLYVQQGTTDSERILYYIVDRINDLNGRGGDDKAKFELISDIVREITPGNKVNFLLYDGDYFYIHKNEPGTLCRLVRPGIAVFSTHPLDDQKWEEFPGNQLIVYRNGDIVYAAEPHGNTYIHDEEKMRFLYLDHSML